jgi:hypothetical protein
MIKGIPNWLVIAGLVLVGIVLITWITGKPPGVTLTGTANASSQNPLVTNPSVVLT